MRRPEQIAEGHLGLTAGDPLWLCRYVRGVLGLVDLASLEALADIDELGLAGSLGDEGVVPPLQPEPLVEHDRDFLPLRLHAPVDEAVPCERLERLPLL